MPITPRHDLETGDGLLAHAVVDPFETEQHAAALHHRRRRHRLLAFATAFATFAVLAVIIAQVGLTDQTPSTGTAPKVAVTGESVGIVLLRPGHEPQRIAPARPVVGVSAREDGASASWSLPDVATIDRVTTSARVAVGARSASAQSRVGSIDLLGGRIQITGAGIDAQAASTDGRAAGSVTLAPSTKLVVDGVAHAAGVNERIAIEGVGTVIINEQAVVANAPTGDAQTGPRFRTVGAIAHLRVTQATLGLPAGSELVIGRVDAGVREGKIRTIEHPDPSAALPQPTPPVGSTQPGLQPGVPRPGTTELPRRAIGVRGGGAAVSPVAAGFGAQLFPILGSSNYVDTWGAARASTGVPHQGTDIFAEQGTPIVAVADGVLDRVGWNTIGGYRFWLFDDAGNSYYHAHLSAFSPLAQDGARVRRGDVIGFVGHTGDAQYTPPHLHFEIHPGNGAPINPFPILNAWKRGVAVAIGVGDAGAAPDRVAPLALLGFTDISSSGGLQASVLDRVPDTRQRSIEQENEPRPTDAALKGAIEGPATSAGE